MYLPSHVILESRFLHELGECEKRSHLRRMIRRMSTSQTLALVGLIRAILREAIPLRTRELAALRPYANVIRQVYHTPQLENKREIMEDKFTVGLVSALLQPVQHDLDSVQRCISVLQCADAHIYSDSSSCVSETSSEKEDGEEMNGSATSTDERSSTGSEYSGTASPATASSEEHDSKREMSPMSDKSEDDPSITGQDSTAAGESDNNDAQKAVTLGDSPPKEEPISEPQSGSGRSHWKCEKCDKIFYRYRAYQEHLNTHLDYQKKPYKCPICSNRYASAAALRHHVRIHQA